MIRFHDYGYGVFNANRRVGPARWDRFDLLYIHRGQIRVTVANGQPIVVPAGQGLIIYPDTPFDGESLATESHASVQHFSFESRCKRANLLKPYRLLHGRTRGHRHVIADDASAVDRAIDHAISLAFQPQSKLIHDMRIAQLAVILGMLEQSSVMTRRPSDDNVIAQLKNYLAAHLDAPISLQQMADHMTMSASHFRARFRKLTGQSPGRFFLELRMQEAARLLRETAAPIKTIAPRVGYTDLSNFYRAFRTIHRISPAAYRQRFTPLA